MWWEGGSPLTTFKVSSWVSSFLLHVHSPNIVLRAQNAVLGARFSKEYFRNIRREPEPPEKNCVPKKSCSLSAMECPGPNGSLNFQVYLYRRFENVMSRVFLLLARISVLKLIPLGWLFTHSISIKLDLIRESTFIGTYDSWYSHPWLEILKHCSDSRAPNTDSVLLAL